MRRCLLLVGGGDESYYGVQCAKNWGWDVVVVDRDPQCFCNIPGVHFLECDIYDSERVAVLALTYAFEIQPITAVICLGSDVPLTVAKVNQKLGLCGVSVENATIASNKEIMKSFMRDNNIPSSDFMVISSDTQAVEFFERNIDSGIVIKPVDSRGSRGISLVKRLDQIHSALGLAKENSHLGRVIAERFSKGPQFSTETLIQKGQVFTIAISDRNYEFLDKYAPHIIENGGDLPSSLDPLMISNLENLIEQVCNALGIQDGTLKGDMVFDEEAREFKVIEFALRLSGGYFASHEIPLSTGYAYVENAIRVAAGIPIDDPVRLSNQYISQRYLFLKPGRVMTIANVSSLENFPGFEFARYRVNIGDVIANIEHHRSRVGVVIFSGTSREEAQKRACSAIQYLEINSTVA